MKITILNGNPHSDNAAFDDYLKRLSDTLTSDGHVDWELISGPFLGRGGYRLAPVEGGTQFTLVADVEPAGVYKLLGPLFAWMGRRQNQADVEKLRDILESTAD